MASQQLLDFYAQQSAMTAPGKYQSLLEALPADIDTMVRIVQGLLIYDEVAEDFYGFTVPEARRQEIHIRRVTRMLDSIFSLDDRPLAIGRPPEKRLVGRCHHSVLLLLAILRTKGVPARARCGFGAYFNPGYFEDHWVVEYWNAHEKRWILVDPLHDAVWRKKLHIQFDIFDVPRDQFLVAADAWRKCRVGTLDPEKFGITFVKLYGLWYIAGNLVRDLAALNKVEVLPWDTWGVQPKPNEELTQAQVALFDTIAGLTAEPDTAFDQLRKAYDEDPGLRPETVFNALLERPEKL